jgi:hypothetical protein
MKCSLAHTFIYHKLNKSVRTYFKSTLNQSLQAKLVGDQTLESMQHVQHQLYEYYICTKNNGYLLSRKYQFKKNVH